jgi:bifunctional DNA-binding transcriptional regulator/antitoxin component of YhaV-PrlF toxin-antitoxin module
MRDRLGITPGDEVEFELEDHAVRVERVSPRESLKGRFAGRNLTKALEADHRRERAR